MCSMFLCLRVNQGGDLTPGERATLATSLQVFPSKSHIIIPAHFTHLTSPPPAETCQSPVKSAAAVCLWSKQNSR